MKKFTFVAKTSSFLQNGLEIKNEDIISILNNNISRLDVTCIYSLSNDSFFLNGKPLSIDYILETLYIIDVFKTYEDSLLDDTRISIPDHVNCSSDFVTWFRSL